jgi:8-oxo-dGTP pyrophosphatase MutT (NUDIX family)
MVECGYNGLIEGVVRPSALIIEDCGFLAVRHRNEDFFCLPGGKKDDGEGTEDALVREVGEETSLSIGELTILHRLRGISPGDGQFLQLPLYRARKTTGKVAVKNETAEALWIGPENYHRIKVASKIRTHIIPGMIAGNWQHYVKQYPLYV